MTGPSAPSVAIRLDFPGASLAVHRIERDTVHARLRREALCRADGAVYDYNHHFACGVENLTSEPCTIQVLIGTDGIESLPDEPALLYGAPTATIPFSQVDLISRSDANQSCAFMLPLRGGEIRYVANYFFRPYDHLTALFDRLGRDGHAVREVIGTTVEGRELVAYHYHRGGADAGGRPAVLVTSGFHPPEPDTLGSEAIMEWLAGADGAALRETVDVHVVPLMNPDGFVHGYNGCNAHEINFYWLFDPHDPDRRPEAHALWRLIERTRPVVYLDWHGYTFQRGARHAAPYVKPVVFHAGRAVRRLVRTMNRRVRAVADGRATTGFLTYAPSTLAKQITARFNTITYAKFHLELRLGIPENKRLAVETIQAIVDTLRAEHFLDPTRILKAPYGRVPSSPVRQAVGRVQVWWGGRGRPALGRIRRRLLGRPHRSSR